MEAVLCFCGGNDVFISLPTGYGKSIIYGILPRVFDLLRGGNEKSILLCISPLTAIMIDQKEKFASAGIAFELLGEAQTDNSASHRVINGSIQLVFISPENLLCNLKYRQMLLSPVYKERLIGVAVDEAHCIKTWGDDFRTAFSQIGELRSLFPTSVHFLALTATATCSTMKAVIEHLSLQNPVVIGTSPNRPNIYLSMWDKMKLEELVECISADLAVRKIEYPKTIIFCQTYKDVNDLYLAFIKHLGEDKTAPAEYPNLLQFCLITMYTSASTDSMKKAVLSTFTKIGSTLRIVIATTAFSMNRLF